ncbi:MAG: phosphotransferase [Tenacibaculum sp.]
MEQLINLNSIIKQFQVQGNLVSANRINSGRINTTYIVNTTKSSYILQKINHSVFKNVEALTQNIIRITEHLKLKSLEENKKNLEVIFTKTQVGFYKDSKGSFWRMFNYFSNSVTFEVLKNKHQAKTLGMAFANFQKQLIDLPSPPLFEVLPNFHNTPIRIEQFKKAVKKNTYNRLSVSKKQVNYLLNLAPEMHEIINLGKQKRIPLRNIHQDTKLSNILFNSNNEAICIIDLDTTMPGYLCYDFGDAVRTGMNTASEEEKDLDKVGLNLKLFKSFTKGYIAISKDFITSAEIDTLVLGVKIITYEQATRFLTDYLNGDFYYKPSYPESNLQRAKVQITFLKYVIKHFNKMHDFVKKQYTN